MVKEQQLGNIHEVELEAMEERHMGEDEEKKDEDKDNNEASQLREEEEEEESGRGGKKDEEENGKHHAKEDSKREGNDGQVDKTSPIQFSPPNPNFSFM